jgi:hypothetical protein
LFTSLVETLGPDDFLFALLAMLAEKYPLDADILPFTAELSGRFSAEVRLSVSFASWQNWVVSERFGRLLLSILIWFSTP